MNDTERRGEGATAERACAHDETGRDQRQGGRPEHGAYARAREDGPLLSRGLNESPRSFVAWARRIAAEVRPAEWRRRMARRNAAISRLLRAVQRELGAAYAGKRKVDGGWSVLASAGPRVVVAVDIEVPPLRSFADFKVPPRLAVIRPDLVNIRRLEDGLRRRV